MAGHDLHLATGRAAAPAAIQLAETTGPMRDYWRPCPASCCRAVERYRDNLPKPERASTEARSGSHRAHGTNRQQMR